MKFYYQYRRIGTADWHTAPEQDGDSGLHYVMRLFSESVLKPTPFAQ